MELLIAFGISTVTQLLKWLSKKFGQENSKSIIALFVFLLCGIFALLLNEEILTWELIKSYATIYFAAVGYYKTVYKWWIEPAINNAFKK